MQLDIFCEGTIIMFLSVTYQRSKLWTSVAVCFGVPRCAAPPYLSPFFVDLVCTQTAPNFFQLQNVSRERDWVWEKGKEIGREKERNWDDLWEHVTEYVVTQCVLACVCTCVYMHVGVRVNVRVKWERDREKEREIYGWHQWYQDPSIFIQAGDKKI